MVVGIDVAKGELVIASRPSEERWKRFANKMDTNYDRIMFEVR